MEGLSNLLPQFPGARKCVRSTCTKAALRGSSFCKGHGGRPQAPPPETPEVTT